MNLFGIRQTIGNLQYYQKKSGQEIDFILNEDTAIEVKEMPTQQDLNTLSQRAVSIQLEKKILVVEHRPATAFENFTWAGVFW